jgi:hypothetical protein
MISTRGLVIAAALAVLTLGVTAPAAIADNTSAPEPPKVAAASWLIADATTGEVLAAKHPHRTLRPASTLKTLTAITLLPLLDKHAKYRVKWADAAVEGSAVGIVPDATYTIPTVATRAASGARLLRYTAADCVIPLAPRSVPPIQISWRGGLKPASSAGVVEVMRNVSPSDPGSSRP